IGVIGLPALRGGRSTASGVVEDPVTGATLVTVAGAQAASSPIATTASTGASTPRPALAAASPAATAPLLPRPPVAPATGNTPGSLLDARFAAGPLAGWAERQPYAGWSDGAYRLLARDATRFVAVGVPLDHPLDDLIVNATFRKTGGPPG